MTDMEMVQQRMEAVKRRAAAIVNDREVRARIARMRASCGCVGAEHPTLADWERVHGPIDMSRPFGGSR